MQTVAPPRARPRPLVHHPRACVTAIGARGVVVVAAVVVGACVQMATYDSSRVSTVQKAWSAPTRGGNCTLRTPGCITRLRTDGPTAVPVVRRVRRLGERRVQQRVQCQQGRRRRRTVRLCACNGVWGWLMVCATVSWGGGVWDSTGMLREGLYQMPSAAHMWSCACACAMPCPDRYTLPHTLRRVP